MVERVIGIKYGASRKTADKGFNKAKRRLRNLVKTRKWPFWTLVDN